MCKDTIIRFWKSEFLVFFHFWKSEFFLRIPLAAFIPPLQEINIMNSFWSADKPKWVNCNFSLQLSQNYIFLILVRT